jgi:hypothetical protein
MTLVEFLAPLKSATVRKKVLAVLYYEQRYSGTAPSTVEALRAALARARTPKAAKINVADHLAKSGEYVDSPGTDGGRRVWQLTPSGERYVRELLGLPEDEPEIDHDVSSLSVLAAKIKDETVRSYVDEAIKCLRAGALRAAVVFLWTGAIRTLHEDALRLGAPHLNTALQNRDQKTRAVSKIEHFAWVGDRVFLDATPDMGLLDKGQRDTLIEALNLRNRCGHPTKFKPGAHKVSVFIEDVLGIVFPS